MFEPVGRRLIPILSAVLCLYTLAEVNFPRLRPQSQLALFVMLGLVLCFLGTPARERWRDCRIARLADLALAVASMAACGYVVLMTEPLFHGWFPDFWPYGKSLGNRAGIEGPIDFALGAVGLLLVLEATRRSIGWVVPALAVLFLAHSYYGHLAQQDLLPDLPGWLLPHAGQDAAYLVSTTFSQSLGVFGPAAGVMFKYVFLFVIFGAFLEMSGATRFIIDFAQKVFGGTPGGPAKVAVLGSGLMGSLSGSAVANAVTTGTFTIPMMRHAGFERHVAGGITAAAASGGALVPPVMGAGAYMMLELVQPQVTFLQVAKAALIPAILYYLSIFLIVHFYARRAGAVAADRGPARPVSPFQGLVFFSALGTLILFLLMGFTPFKAVSGSLVVILLLSMAGPGIGLSASPRRWALSAFALVVVLHQAFLAQAPAVPKLRLYAESLINSCLAGLFGLLLFALAHPKLRPAVLDALVKAARNGVALIAASACVGIIIGVVQSTGVATDFSNVIKGVVESSLLLALVGIMICSIILGMGVPSVVCYLLMATLMGSLLEQMGVQPLAAHLFIFYFGMMSMVTPPVALAAYASASIAKARIMKTALASFRFALVGFTLPFMFVYRPELLLLVPRDSSTRLSDRITSNASLDLTRFGNLWDLGLEVGTAILGIFALAAAIAGYLRRPLRLDHRLILFAAAACLLSPDVQVQGYNLGPGLNLGAALALAGVVAANRLWAGLEPASRGEPDEAAEE